MISKCPKKQDVIIQRRGKQDSKFLNKPSSSSMKLVFRTCVLDAQLKNKRNSFCAKHFGTKNDVDVNDCYRNNCELHQEV